MTSQGRQYPDGPLVAPHDVDFGRLPEGLEGWPDNSLDFWPKAAGEFLAGILGPPPEPGPPYVHTFRPPQEFYTRSGKLLYREPSGPAYTLTESS